VGTGRKVCHGVGEGFPKDGPVMHHVGDMDIDIDRLKE
jgi:hypothetical protein